MPVVFFLRSFATCLPNPSQQARCLGVFLCYATLSPTTESVGRIHNLFRRDLPLWIPTLKYYTHVLRRATAIPNHLADMTNNFLNMVVVTDQPFQFAHRFVVGMP